MIALAFLIDTIAGAPRNSDFGTYTAAAAFFKSIGNVAFNFMMPVLAGYIARSIADRPGLAVGFVGGSIATLGCTFANVTGDASAVSGFLGALIAGFVGGFIVLLLKKVFSGQPGKHAAGSDSAAFGNHFDGRVHVLYQPGGRSYQYCYYKRIEFDGKRQPDSPWMSPGRYDGNRYGRSI